METPADRLVKPIAEAAGLRLPGVFGYVGWNCAIQVPLFAGVSLLFFA